MTPKLKNVKEISLEPRPLQGQGYEALGTRLERNVTKQKIMRAEGPKEHPTENYALGCLALHYHIQQTTKFLTPIYTQSTAVA